ncbi:MAG: DUF4279 domain-containing protein [Verrucomicrobia bacterium]|nr:DUF4279 domain-containing protein [Verrucomicrobiota bacterium]
MKAPKPRPPEGAPPGTVWFDGPLEWSGITLRVQGDDLDPEDVSRVLGCEPDLARRRGDPILRSDGSTGRLARTGAWHP